MFSKAQQSAFERAIAAGDKHQKQIDALMQIASISPVFADRVKDLLALHEASQVLAQTALAIQIQALADGATGK